METSSKISPNVFEGKKVFMIANTVIEYYELTHGLNGYFRKLISIEIYKIIIYIQTYSKHNEDIYFMNIFLLTTFIFVIFLCYLF